MSNDNYNESETENRLPILTPETLIVQEFQNRSTLVVQHPLYLLHKRFYPRTDKAGKLLGEGVKPRRR